MLLLLSSSKRKRYRDDILRCIATPQGCRVQFRYSKDLVEDAVWERYTDYEGKDGIVCSVDLDTVGRVCPLVPVRTVTVERIYRHGTTMTLVLVMGALALTNNVDEFSSEIDAKSGGKAPRNKELRDEARGSTGKFFFNAGDVGNLRQETSIENWQAITAMLFTQPGYKEEPFFWTVLGLFPDASGDPAVRVDRLTAWESSLDADCDYALEIYVYHPLTDRWKPEGARLRLTSQPSIQTNYPLDVLVDSPYDVKRWRFRVSSSSLVGTQKGWLRIGPITKNAETEATAPDWEIDLPICVRSAWWRFMLRSAMIGVLIAAPAVISILLQEKPSTTVKALTSLLAVILGMLGAAASGLGLRKPS
jgi:hypothetical protein